MNIFQKHVNKKSKMCEKMFNYQRASKGLKPTSFRVWRITNREIVKELKEEFKFDNKRSLLEFRKCIRKNYKAYKRFIDKQCSLLEP